MTDDDGTQPFGELGASLSVPPWARAAYPDGTKFHWDTPEWREEMQAKYSDGWPLANAA